MNNVHITVRADDNQKAAWKAAADARGQTLSEFMRSCIDLIAGYKDNNPKIVGRPRKK